MDSRRLQLQSKLEELLGNKNVYYQPPSSKRIDYPAIVYSKGTIRVDHANDSSYRKKVQYTLTVLDRTPDNPVIDKLLQEFSYCSYDRNYKSENLEHDVFTLYF